MYKCVMFAIIDFWLVPTFVILADGRPHTVIMHTHVRNIILLLLYYVVI